MRNPNGVIKEIRIFSIKDTHLAPDVIPCKKIRMMVGRMNNQKGIKHTNQDTFVTPSNLHIDKNQNMPMKILGIKIILIKPKSILVLSILNLTPDLNR